MSEALAIGQAAVAVAAGVTELRHVDLVPPDRTSGWLRVEATGVCGSDWGYYQQLPARGPLILGHETAGTIEHLGSEAGRHWGLSEGDQVVLEEYLPCGQCLHCRSADFRLCEATDWRTGGLRYGATSMDVEPGLWGGFSHYQFLHPRTVFHRIPSGLPFRYATLALPVSNGIEWAYRQGGVGPGQVVVILGPGQQGLACALAAREAGAACVIVAGLGHPSDLRRLELAKSLGAHHAVNVEEVDVTDFVGETTGGQMADVVIDCTSGGAASVNTALGLARKKGTVLLASQKREPIPLDSGRIVARALTVKGVRGHSYEAVELALQLLRADRWNVRSMSTHRFDLGSTDAALRMLVDKTGEALHSVVEPWSEPGEPGAVRPSPRH